MRHKVFYTLAHHRYKNHDAPMKSYLIKENPHFIVVCEIKYAEEKVSNSIYAEVRKKLELFQKSQPRFAHYTFETVLITPEGLKDGNASVSFDRVITFKEIFDRRYWG